jgi:hypothetical protein
MRSELPFVAFGAALLVLLPSPLLWRTRNIPLLSSASWLFSLNVIYGVNILIWRDHARLVATVYCDISEVLLLFDFPSGLTQSSHEDDYLRPLRLAHVFSVHGDRPKEDLNIARPSHVLC